MLDFSRFEFFTFDCYGTLIDWEAGILRTMHLILAAHSRVLKDADILSLYGDFEAAAEAGTFRNYREVLRTVVARFGEQLSFTPTEHEINSLPESLETWHPWPDSVAALRRLKTRYKLAIISNVDDDLFVATKPYLEVEFSVVTTAQQARAYKPSLQIFELALSRIGTPADRVLHVGQSIFHDVIPAQKLGIATVWVNRPSARSGVGAVKLAQAVPDLEVRSLQELAARAQL